MSDFTLQLSQREIEVIRQALRYAEETHKRNDFKVLVLEVQDLRSKINDAIISASTSKSLV
jgi:Arc/MetJ-type ribon-helix-helix transcriptional regulator